MIRCETSGGAFAARTSARVRVHVAPSLASSARCCSSQSARSVTVVIHVARVPRLRSPEIHEGIQGSERMTRPDRLLGLFEPIGEALAQRRQLLLDPLDLRARRELLVQGTQDGADLVRPPRDLGDWNRRRRIGGDLLRLA